MWATLVLTVVGGLAVACSSGSATREAAQEAAQEWATKVCGALGPWRSAITDLNQQAQAEVSAATSPDQARASLLRLLAGAESATEQAHAAVLAAGTPDVAGGAEVAQSFGDSLAAARTAYAQAGVDLQALSTSDEHAFYDGVVTVLASLTDAYAAAGVDPSTLDSPELRQAFDEVDTCR
jgi:hypothetical protein